MICADYQVIMLCVPKVDGVENEEFMWTPSKEQCLIIRADVQTEINFEVLATMFHMDLAELEAMTILVDNIPSKNYDVYAFLCDTNAIQVRQKIKKIFFRNRNIISFQLNHRPHF